MSTNVIEFVTVCANVQTVQQNAYHKDKYAQEFGIKISENLASVEARILPAPWVTMISIIRVLVVSCVFSLLMIVYFISSIYAAEVS